MTVGSSSSSAWRSSQRPPRLRRRPCTSLVSYGSRRSQRRKCSPTRRGSSPPRRQDSSRWRSTRPHTKRPRPTATWPEDGAADGGTETTAYEVARRVLGSPTPRIPGAQEAGCEQEQPGELLTGVHGSSRHSRSQAVRRRRPGRRRRRRCRSSPVAVEDGRSRGHSIGVHLLRSRRDEGRS
jgi:hypothetical protein